jgi:hypothetical protein
VLLRVAKAGKLQWLDVWIQKIYVEFWKGTSSMLGHKEDEATAIAATAFIV